MTEESENNALAVTVHHNNEVTVKDERGYPNVCRECRFSGWRDNDNYKSSSEPNRCLLYSGGADPVDGDRIMHGLKVRGVQRDNRNWEPGGEYGDLYPRCTAKNPDGKCTDFVRAKPIPWLGNFWLKLFSRDWRTRKMRL